MIKIQVKFFVIGTFIRSTFRTQLNVQDESFWKNSPVLQVTATDMRYFVRSKFSRSLVHKKKTWPGMRKP